MPPRSKAGQRAYYLKLGSGGEQVVGSSRDRYHVGWMKLQSVVPPGQPGFAVSGGHGRVTSRELAITKFADRTSHELLLAASEGRHYKSAVIDVADAETGIPELRLTLTDVLIGRFTVNPNARAEDPGPGETFALDFGNLEYNYNPIPEENVGDMLQSVFKSLGLAPA